MRTGEIGLLVSVALVLALLSVCWFAENDTAEFPVEDSVNIEMAEPGVSMGRPWKRLKRASSNEAKCDNLCRETGASCRRGVNSFSIEDTAGIGILGGPCSATVNAPCCGDCRGHGEKAQCCATARQVCLHTSQCCGNGTICDSTYHICCLPSREKCTKGRDCCEGDCINSKCCRQEADSCEGQEDCCGDLLEFQDPLNGGDKGCCTPGGQFCTSDSFCCGEPGDGCLQNTKNTAFVCCVEDGKPCEVDARCCSEISALESGESSFCRSPVGGTEEDQDLCCIRPNGVCETDVAVGSNAPCCGDENGNILKCKSSLGSTTEKRCCITTGDECSTRHGAKCCDGDRDCKFEVGAHSAKEKCCIHDGEPCSNSEGARCCSDDSSGPTLQCKDISGPFICVPKGET